MIVPILLGLRDFVYAPITWTLVFLNLFFYFITMDADRIHKPSAASAVIMETKGLQRTGVFYRQFLNMETMPHSSELMAWGGKALRDPEFLKVSADFPFKGDPMEIRSWRQDLTAYTEANESRSLSKFGLSKNPAVALKKPLTWVTYQFMHAGVLHLLSNMIFLLIFGIALERNTGSFISMLAYVGGGIAGAAFGLLTDTASVIPMVGASAAVSAVMACYLVSEHRKNLRYFYFLSPLQGGFGEIYLSKWWILPICFVPDLVNFSLDMLMTGQDLIGRSVATSAHVGGALFGAGLGFILVARNLSAPYFPSRPEAP